jgi:hypothetical protein
MPIPEIEEFAKILVHEVRDAAIQSCDREFEPNAGSPIARRWKEATHSVPCQEFAKLILPDIVDSVMFHLLHAIDEGFLKLSYTATNGKTADLNADRLGELAGWFGAGTGGWLSKYAKERFADDISDLEDFFAPKVLGTESMATPELEEFDEANFIRAVRDECQIKETTVNESLCDKETHALVKGGMNQTMAQTMVQVGC